MLEYLYTMVYPNTGTDFRPASELVFDARMYATADKYGLPDLKRQVREAFMQLLPDHIEDAVFAEAARAVYDLTPETDRELRDPVKTILWDKRASMFARKEIQQCIRECAGLREDMLQAIFAQPMSVGREAMSKSTTPQAPAPRSSIISPVFPGSTVSPAFGGSTVPSAFGASTVSPALRVSTVPSAFGTSINSRP